MVRATLLRLPGQQKPASAALRAAIMEVQGRLEKPIIFKDISRHPHLSSGAVVQGYLELYGDKVTVWVDAGLPVSAQEAVAAHELAHLAQRLEGFPVAAAADKSPSPDEDRLLARLNNLVLDDHADRWAVSRGFRIDRALQAGKLGEIQAAIAALPTAAPKTAGSTDTSLALTYAGLKIRLDRYGLFDELDRLWARRWPQVRLQGLSIVESLKSAPVFDAASAANALNTVAANLGIRIKLRFH